MNRTATALLLWVGMTYAIGYQHCIFDSRATQGTPWQGSSSIITEHYDITVMPSYLDVNLDLEFDCNGAVAPDSFTDALEIMGNMNLAQDAAVTGMLLWNGEEILKAKLKPLQLAREQYEEVVDRNADAPPPPRDPVIFEYGWGEDNYYLSIFPVKWQGSRKLRMRYVIPAINMNGHADIPFPTAFNRSIATYKLSAGTGVTAVATVTNSGVTKPLPVPASFDTKSTNYTSTIMIRPEVEKDNGGSKFYTTSMNLSGFEGSLTHVVGRTGADVISSADMSEDIVFLWRWNHSDYLHLYKKQITEQARLLMEFMEKIAGSNKRAGLIVDRSGGEKRVFAIDSTESASGKRMLYFLDSLSDLPYTEGGPWYQPDFTSGEKDSLLALSMEEFRGALRHAESLFDLKREKTIRRIIVMTAGPVWLQSNTTYIVPEIDSSILIAPIATLNKSAALAGLELPADATVFYWPGINAASVSRSINNFTVEAVLTTQSGERITTPVPATEQRYNYSWNYHSPHLDKKLHSLDPLKPEITWKIYNNGSLVTEVTEVPQVVPQGDPVQFAAALSSGEFVETIDGELPVSLAATFGFVDKQYALLALEEDVMAPLDQQRFRLTGVPALTDADITLQPDDGDTPPQQPTVDQPATRAQRQAATALPATSDALYISIHRSQLTVTFGLNAGKLPASASIEVYTLSGKLLYRLKKADIINGTIRCLLPAEVVSSRQTLIVMVRVGAKVHTLRMIGNGLQTIRNAVLR